MDELREAIEAGIDLCACTRVRACIRGASWWPEDVDPHLETLDAHRRGIDLDQYGFLRNEGVLHADVVGAIDRSITLEPFASLVRNGHPDTGIPIHDLPTRLLEAHDRGDNLDAFALAWRSRNFPTFP